MFALVEFDKFLPRDATLARYVFLSTLYRKFETAKHIITKSHGIPMTLHYTTAGTNYPKRRDPFKFFGPVLSLY